MRQKANNQGSNSDEGRRHKKPKGRIVPLRILKNLSFFRCLTHRQLFQLDSGDPFSIASKKTDRYVNEIGIHERGA